MYLSHFLSTEQKRFQRKKLDLKPSNIPPLIEWVETIKSLSDHTEGSLQFTQVVNHSTYCNKGQPHWIRPIHFQLVKWHVNIYLQQQNKIGQISFFNKRKFTCQIILLYIHTWLYNIQVCNLLTIGSVHQSEHIIPANFCLTPNPQVDSEMEGETKSFYLSPLKKWRDT